MKGFFSHAWHYSWYLLVFFLTCVARDSHGVMVQSPAVEWDGFSYVITGDTTTPEKLLLRRSRWEAEDAQANDKSELSIEGLSFQKGAVLLDVKLAVWTRTALLAVVITEMPDSTRTASLLWFPDADVAKHRIIPALREVHSEKTKFVLLAFEGAFQGDGIVIVLGVVVREPRARKVESITVFLEDCPLPDFDGGRKSSFGGTSARGTNTLPTEKPTQ